MSIVLMPAVSRAPVKSSHGFHWRTPTKLDSDGSLHDSDFHRDLQVDIEAVLSRGVTLNRAKTRWISLIKTADGPMVVKMFIERGWRHSIKRAFKRPRATLYAERARQLVAAGISTPAPVATVAERYAGLIGNSCVVYRYTAGETLRDFLQSIAADESLMPTQRCRILDQLRCRMVSIGEKLAEMGIAHGDAHPGNFIIDENHSIHLLDLDALHPTRRRRQLLRSRQHFQKIVDIK